MFRIVMNITGIDPRGWAFGHQVPTFYLIDDRWEQSTLDYVTERLRAMYPASLLLPGTRAVGCAVLCRVVTDRDPEPEHNAFSFNILLSET